MIPKVAHFYWYGDEPLPALRRQSVDSFRAFHPDWSVSVHHSGDGPATFRTKVLRSDAARYGVLHRAGGVYFDTDIIFTRPIPEAWLERDLILPCMPSGEIYGVHVLGATPGSEFFRQAIERVKLRMESPKMLGCQSLGTHLWCETNLLDLADRMRLSVQIVPLEAYLSVSANVVEVLWSPIAMSRGIYGLHWYGGDRLSEEYQDTEFDALPDSMVKRALALSRDRVAA